MLRGPRVKDVIVKRFQKDGRPKKLIRAFSSGELKTSPEPLGQFQPDSAQSIHSQKGGNEFFSLIKSTLWLNHSCAQMCSFIGTVYQVSDVAHGPLV